MGNVSDGSGAFVEVDINKLDKDLLIMLGMKQALEKYVGGFRAQAASLAHEGTAAVLREVADIMDVDLQKITVEFSKRAINAKAATLHEIKRGRD
jgi:hypothetical protein